MYAQTQRKLRKLSDSMLDQPVYLLDMQVPEGVQF